MSVTQTSTRFLDHTNPHFQIQTCRILDSTYKQNPRGVGTVEDSTRFLLVLHNQVTETLQKALFSKSLNLNFKMIYNLKGRGGKREKGEEKKKRRIPFFFFQLGVGTLIFFFLGQSLRANSWLCFSNAQETIWGAKDGTLVDSFLVFYSNSSLQKIKLTIIWTQVRPHLCLLPLFTLNMHEPANVGQTTVRF